MPFLHESLQIRYFTVQCRDYVAEENVTTDTGALKSLPLSVKLWKGSYSIPIQVFLLVYPSIFRVLLIKHCYVTWEQ